MNILVLVSGGGTNLQALLDVQTQGRFGDSRITTVVSDRAGVYALERAQNAGICAIIEEPDKRVPREKRRRELSDRVLHIAGERGIGLIILAGFLSILEGEIVAAYSGRIINLHPALLPKYGGAGMYGDHVHQAVLDAGETESGCTVHLVDAGTDTGPILLQRRVPVLPGDNVETLAQRIHREEHVAIVEATVMMIEKLRTCERAVW
ncbi:MAG: phosphoribosylglycinamide formyltransferase [Treponema sp.]|jgi:phosphoribosylglycinamide formyltransferase-1|nr:phosphoribosylglycinamide formyltransferase [Treponema sp.]